MDQEGSTANSQATVGRELDALIAKKVMGWHSSADGDSTVYSPWWQEPDARFVCPVGGFAPSTRIEDAWKVVEKCGLSVIRSDDGWYALKPEDIVWGCVRGTDFPKVSLVGAEGEHDPFSIAYDSAPEAICFAALRAMDAPSAVDPSWSIPKRSGS